MSTSSEIHIKNYQVSFTLILLTTFLIGSAVDIFIPSLPYITEAFHTNANITKQAVMIYLVTYGICQFFAGSFSDSFGRRETMLISLLGYTICTFMITLTTHVEFFLILRATQGAFAAGVGVNNRAFMSDSFSGKTLSKYSSYLLIAWASGPILAPFIGGYLQHYINWQSCFYFISLLGTVTFILMFFWLPETLKQKTEFKLKPLLKNYYIILSNRNFVIGALIAGIVYGFITVYNVVGPFLIQKTLHYNSTVYGHIALLLGLGWLCGILYFRYRLAKNRINLITKTSLYLSLFMSVVMIILSTMGYLNLYTASIPVIILFIFGALIFTETFSQTIKIFPHIGGSASAALGAIFSVISGLVSGLAGFINTLTLLPLAIFYCAIIIIALILYTFQKYN